MGRPLRIIQTEYPYHITTRTNNKEIRFKQNRSTFLLFAKVINEAIKKYNIDVTHFVLMGNHYHLLVKAKQTNIHRAMQYINSRVAREYNKRHKRTGHLWGDRYRSTIVENDEHYLKCIQYIYLNPVRAGLSKGPEGYEPSTYEFYSKGKKIEIFVNGCDIFISLGEDEFERSRKFIHLINSGVGDDFSQVRKGLKSLFYGSDKFLDLMKKRFKHRLSN